MIELSVVIPVHQEERLLERAAIDMAAQLDARRVEWELILVENGSRDATRAIAERIATESPRVRVIAHDRPDYGASLCAGLFAARGEIVICEEIDIGDVDFLDRAVEILRTQPHVAIVIGSKACAGAHDNRPWLRRIGTRAINFLLRVAVGYAGTDTHGVKALRRESILPVVNDCVLRRDLFASELVVRAARAGLEVREIPVDVRERRPPSAGLLRRVPHALWSLARLAWILRR